MKLKINIVDAFTDTQFKGNSAAVIITEQWLDASLMQAIAAENNLSETAFLRKITAHHYQIRWFSPLTEVDFCGHATLAAAFVIFSSSQSASDKAQTLTIEATAVGEMNITQLEDGAIEMKFPNRKPTLIETIPSALRQGLSIQPAQVLINNQAYFAIYPDEQQVLALQYNSDALKTLAPLDVVVTAKSTDYDFISRYFWPANGGDEDPVTGSIHTGLAPYWAEQLGKSDLVAYQASTRGGVLNCQVQGDIVTISGKAVHYLEGFIEV